MATTAQARMHRYHYSALNASDILDLISNQYTHQVLAYGDDAFATTLAVQQVAGQRKLRTKVSRAFLHEIMVVTDVITPVWVISQVSLTNNKDFSCMAADQLPANQWVMVGLVVSRSRLSHFQLLPYMDSVASIIDLQSVPQGMIVREIAHLQPRTFRYIGVLNIT